MAIYIIRPFIEVIYNLTHLTPCITRSPQGTSIHIHQLRFGFLGDFHGMKITIWHHQLRHFQAQIQEVVTSKAPEKT